MICGYSSLFCPSKFNMLWWFSFVFYCFVACLTGYISVYKLATLRSCCGSRSHIANKSVAAVSGTRYSFGVVLFATIQGPVQLFQVLFIRFQTYPNKVTLHDFIIFSYFWYHLSDYFSPEEGLFPQFGHSFL